MTCGNCVAQLKQAVMEMEPCPLQHKIPPHRSAARCQKLHPPCYLGAAPVSGRGRHDMAGSCRQLRLASAGQCPKAGRHWEPHCRAPAQLAEGLSCCRAQGRSGTRTCGLWGPPAAEIQQRGVQGPGSHAGECRDGGAPLLLPLLSLRFPFSCHLYFS